MRKMLSVFGLGILFVCACEQVALATVFDCKTVEKGMWDHGHFKGKTNGGHEIFIFDDETGTLLSAWDAHSPQLPQQMRVLQKKISGYNLVAISVPKEDGHVSFASMFQISEESDYGFEFLFWNGSLLFSGKCSVQK